MLPPIVRITGTLLMLFLMASCGNQKPEALIEGNLSDIENKRLILYELDLQELRPIDSVKVSPNENFSFSLALSQAGFYLLEAEQDHFINLIVEPGDQINITGSIENYKITGSVASNIFTKYLRHTNRNEKYVDSLTKIVRRKKLFDDQGKLSPGYRYKFDSVMQDQKDFAGQLIKDNPGSLASLLILNQQFGRLPLFTMQNNLELFLLVDSTLMVKYSDNKHAIDHHQRIELKRRELKEKEKAEKRLAVGKTMPDVSLKDTLGLEISLHSLKGKKVIVYFWSALDAKSRQGNRALKKLFNTLNKKNYAIYAVSLDPGREIWKNAVKLDELDWVNVNDPEGPRSAVIKLYNLPANLPYYYLLDEDSRIKFKGQDPEKLKYAVEQL